MRFQVSLPLCLLALLLAAPLFAQRDIVTMYDGSRYDGRVDRITADSVYLTLDPSIPLVVARGIVREMSTLVRHYPFIGATLLLPGGFNLTGGYKTDGWLIRGTLGTVFDGGTWGAQINVGHELSHSPSFTHHLSIGLVHSEVMSESSNSWFTIRTLKIWDAVGVYYDLNWRGFFLETGLTVGEGSYSNPQLSLALGYVYQFDILPWRSPGAPPSDR